MECLPGRLLLSTIVHQSKRSKQSSDLHSHVEGLAVQMFQQGSASRVGQGPFWWQVCPASKPYQASFWQGFPRQTYAKVLRTASKCRGSLEAVTGEQFASWGHDWGCHTWSARQGSCTWLDCGTATTVVDTALSETAIMNSSIKPCLEQFEPSQ